MNERPQGLRPWARRIPLPLLPLVARLFIGIGLPFYLGAALWTGLCEWASEMRRPF